MHINKIKLWFIVFSSFITVSCKTIDLEKTAEMDKVNNSISKQDEENNNQQAMHEYYVQEELKVQDMKDTVVYIDRPIYRPEQEEEITTDKKIIAGKAAVENSLAESIKKPSEYKKGTFFYQYNENLVYEIYAQPFHLTDIILEPGEIVMGTPLFSEDETVWELTANVAKENGLDVQHLFIKPAYANQDSTLIIITDRRVYHFRTISYSTTHMAMVRFTYPQSQNVWARKDGTTNNTVENSFIKVSNPEFLSFNYVIKHSIFQHPEFIPEHVYDDGQSTYIQVNDVVLQKKLPVLFNEKNEIVNYIVKKNVFIVNRLINKMTLRLGKEKVEIEKKKAKLSETEKTPSGEIDGQ